MPDRNGLPRYYTSYLLRVWRHGQAAGYRAFLENIGTGERVGFDALADLIDFLETQTAGEETAPAAQEAQPPESGVLAGRQEKPYGEEV